MAEQGQLSGPHLFIAAFCEKVLIEANQIVSLIRLVDRFTVSGTAAEMSPATLNMYLVVGFKSGFIRGKQTIRVVPTSPTGREMAPVEFPQLFEGDDRGNMIAAEMNFLAQEEGLYWFDVTCDSVPITRIPLRVMYQRVASASPGRPR
jgi:hypothetical protein